MPPKNDGIKIKFKRKGGAKFTAPPGVLLNLIVFMRFASPLLCVLLRFVFARLVFAGWFCKF